MWKSDQERSEFFSRFESDEAMRLASELEQKSFRPADPDKPQIFYSGSESTKSGGEATPVGVANKSRPGLFSYESYSRLSEQAAKSEYGFTKIEDTEGGEWLKSNVWNAKVDIPKADKERLGDLASRFYARGAQGDVVAVVGDAKIGAFYREEWKELIQNEKVRFINGVPREVFSNVARERGYDCSFEMVRETVPNPNRQYLNGQSREAIPDHSHWPGRRETYDQAMKEAAKEISLMKAQSKSAEAERAPALVPSKQEELCRREQSLRLNSQASSLVKLPSRDLSPDTIQRQQGPRRGR